MAKIEEIINILQGIAPIEAQDDWDNSGWQIRLSKKNINKIMLCVTVTDEILRQAKEKNCDMIISHHPMIFSGNDIHKEIIQEAIREHFPVYSIHTPLDKAKEGTTDSLIKICGLNIDEVLNAYTKISYAEITLKELVERLKKGLNIKNLRVTNYEPDKIVKKAAFCAGSGTSFWEDVQNADCEVFVTADLKYHTALDFKGTIVDVGHLEGEKPALNTIKKVLNNVECEIAKEISPIEII